jgi:hypothetical protein
MDPVAAVTPRVFRNRRTRFRIEPGLVIEFRHDVSQQTSSPASPALPTATSVIMITDAWPMKEMSLIGVTVDWDHGRRYRAGRGCSQVFPNTARPSWPQETVAHDAVTAEGDIEAMRFETDRPNQPFVIVT